MAHCAGSRRPTAATLTVAVTALLTLAAACGSDGGGGGSTGSTAAAPTSPPSSTGDAATTTGAAATTAATTGDPPAVKAVTIADFDAPLALAVRKGDAAMYVAEKGGRVKALRDGAVDRTLVLDLSGQVSSGGEQGLLGLAFSPAGDHLYVNYTDEAGDTRVVEYAFTDGRVDAGSRRELLAVEQPFANHNGGQVVFGPDGFLYIGLGDGGSGGDPQGNGQRLDTLLGKILRINPSPDGARPYSIPPGNPFADRSGARPEIWAYGLRNPWRFTFDRETGAMWIGDVGQDAVEEIDAVEASAGGGQNYGWNRLEGTRQYSGTAPARAVAPVHEYSHDGGNCSVTGGYVYRGTKMPGLRGSYVFADYCNGRLRALVRTGASGPLRSVALGPAIENVLSFGEDASGEVYVLSVSSGLSRLEAAG